MADKDRASTYSVYDPGTYLCPSCDGYGWYMLGHSKMTCQRCDGIGNVGGDAIGRVSSIAHDSVVRELRIRNTHTTDWGNRR